MMKRAPTLLLASLVMILVWAPTPVRAAPAPTPATGATAEPDPGAKKKARKHFAKGSRHYSKERYKQAIAEFNQAYSLWKNPRILLNIAICYSEMGDAVKAVTFLRRALKTANDEQRAKLQKSVPPKLQARKGEVADLEVVMPNAAAEIYLNGELAGRSPVQRVVAPGTVRLTVKLNGQVKVTKTLELKAGERRTFSLEGWPATDAPKPPGRSWRARLAKLPVYYVGAAALLTLVGLGALIGTAVRTEQIQDDYYANPSLDTHDKGIRYRTATNVLIGVTVAAGVATGVLALFTDWKRLPWKKEQAANTLILPSVGPGGIGLSASGSF